MSGNLQPTGAPKNKVIASTGGAAVGTALASILTWIITAILAKFDVSVPADVSTSLAVIFTAVATFAAGYYTPPGANEGVVVGDDGGVRSAVRR